MGGITVDQLAASLAAIVFLFTDEEMSRLHASLDRVSAAVGAGDFRRAVEDLLAVLSRNGSPAPPP